MESVIGDKNLVKLIKVTFSHPGQDVFREFSADIPPGLVVLQGDEGTGKTTLVKLIAGHLPLVSGLIEYPPLCPHEHSVLMRHQYFLVGEDADDWESRTPLAFFEHCRARYGALDASLLEVLVDDLGLREHVEKNLYMLSRGSKRKVWLVAALAVGAPITLMDDPFIALDHQSARALKGWISQAAGWSDKSLILTQHVPDDELKPTYLIDLNKVH